MANNRFSCILTIFVACTFHNALMETSSELTERDLMLEAFKIQILEKLGMDKPPKNPSVNIITEFTDNITHFYRDLEETIQHEYDPAEASLNEEILQLNPSNTRIIDDIDDNTRSGGRYRIVFSLPHYHKKRMRKVTIESAMLYLYIVGQDDSDCVLFEESQSNSSDENDTKDMDHAGLDFLHLTDFDQQTTERERNKVKADNDRGRIKITIYEVNATNHQQGDGMYRLGNTGWWKFNFTNIIRQWQRSGTRRIRLHVDITLYDVSNNSGSTGVRIITEPCNETDLYHPSYRMFNSDVMNTLPRLDIQYVRDVRSQKNIRHRSRRETLRSSQSCDRFSYPYPCCKKSTMVDMKELGLSDVVLAPPSFMTAYCTGVCSKSCAPSEVKAEFTNYPLNSYCCGPTETEPLRVLLLVEDSLVLTEIPIVTNCGCDNN